MGIAEIFNIIAETGQYPEEISKGILIPLPKPGKKPGPLGHLRPIILLSVLRKILEISMIGRSMEKIKKKIPPTQVTYQQGQSTTEQVCSMKILAEKAIISSNYKIFILLLDMSKVFDTVRRNDLFDVLKEILDKDEIHMIKILIEYVELGTIW